MPLTAEERRQVCRQNGRRSTGPKTVAGKIKSSLNATTHGLSVKNLRMFRGNTRELQDKLDSWMQFYKPTGPAERALVERAVVALIQKRRCLAAARNHVLESVDPADAVAAMHGCEAPKQAGPDRQEDAPGTSVLALYRRYEQMHRQEFHSAFRALLKSRSEAVRPASERECPEAADIIDDGIRGFSQVGYY
jgi:hypothetical protein